MRDPRRYLFNRPFPRLNMIRANGHASDRLYDGARAAWRRVIRAPPAPAVSPKFATMFHVKHSAADELRDQLCRAVARACSARR
jgi:hypothetical protein